MGVLRSEGGARVTLAERTLVGRAWRCLLRIAHPRVSAEHAAVAWSGEEWVVRDLGSANGTFYGTRQITPHEDVPIRCGPRLIFGTSEWVLESDAPPLTRAVCREDGQTIEQDEDGMLLLAEAPDATMVFPDGCVWVLDSPGAPLRTVEDHEVIDVGGRSWVLELCSLLDSATDTTDKSGSIWLGKATLRFLVSRDHEHVTLQVVRSNGEVVELPHRCHQYVLLALAQRRLEDERQGLPAEEAGWVYTDELQDMVSMSRQRLHTEVHRARVLLGEHGVIRTQEVVERRKLADQLRVGGLRVEIHRS